MIEDILIPFFAVALAELGDKTQLAIFFIASKTKNHSRLLLGVFSGFALSCALAVIFGNVLSSVIPFIYVKIIGGLLFIALGLLMLFRHAKKDGKHKLADPFISGFAITFISELFDKTQITTALFAAYFDPIPVFIGSLLALFILSAIAIYLGRILAEKIEEKLISYAAGTLFILIGFGFLFA